MNKGRKFQDILKEEQPVVYQMMYNSLRNRKVSHAYLFSGPRGTHKKDAAILLAQSLICENGVVFACEECNTCRRIRENTYGDLIYVDGREATVKTEVVEDIMERFDMTGMEEANRKVFIIDGAEHMIDNAQNKLLKFIEDPMNSSVTSIFLSENPERILPTIISRCQRIPFSPLSEEAVCRECEEEGMDPLDSYLLAYIYKDKETVYAMKERKDYLKVKTLFIDFMEALKKDKNQALLEVETALLTAKKKDKKTIKLFADMVSLFFSDLLKNKTGNDAWYNQTLDFFKKTNYNNYNSLNACLIAQSRLAPIERNSAPLVLEQMIYQL